MLARINRRKGGRVGLDTAVNDLTDEVAPVIVVDASVLANAVGDDGIDGSVARRRLADAGEGSILDLADVETVAVLRKRWLAGDLTARRFRSAITICSRSSVRFPTGPLMVRAYELRANVTAYDASYVALAEGLACTLVTADTRLALFRPPTARSRFSRDSDPPTLPEPAPVRA